RSPVVQFPHQGMTTVVCLALTVASWVTDVASLIGTALGYGLTTTRDLAMEAHGLHSGHTLPRHRWIAYEAMLGRPPESRVLSHFSPLEDHSRSPFLPSSGQWHDDLVFVWLRESDDLLRDWAQDGPNRKPIDAIIEDRQRISDFASSVPHPSRVITLDVSLQ